MSMMCVPELYLIIKSFIKIYLIFLFVYMQTKFFAKAWVLLFLFILMIIIIRNKVIMASDKSKRSMLQTKLRTHI